MTKKTTPFTTFIDTFSRHGIRCLIIVCLLLSVSSVAFADEPRVVMSGEFSNNSELIIGSDLRVGLVLAKPDTIYNVQLFDEADDLVAEFLGLESDRNGTTREELLWTRTGVTGCNDPCTPHDPTIYSFENFADAEATLDGREFLIRVFEGDISNQDVAVKADVPMVAQPPYLRGYPSNGSGCLRTGFGLGEPMFVAISHLRIAAQPVTVFLVDKQPSWTTGDPLNDVRPWGPATVMVPPGGNPWIEVMWIWPNPGSYQIILRWGGGTVPIFDTTTDVVSEVATTPVGGTYPECLVCPPPP